MSDPAKPPITVVVTGGQTGADQAGWRAAKRFNILTGGWMPKFFATEAGARPDFATVYGAQEHHAEDYPSRTRINLAYAAERGGSAIAFDAGRTMSPGTKCLNNACFDLIRRGIPSRVTVIKLVSDGYGGYRVANDDYLPGAVAANLIHGCPLMVAGNRESSSPGIGAVVEDYLCDLFRALGMKEPACAARPGAGGTPQHTGATSTPGSQSPGGASGAGSSP